MKRERIGTNYQAGCINPKTGKPEIIELPVYETKKEWYELDEKDLGALAFAALAILMGG